MSDFEQLQKDARADPMPRPVTAPAKQKGVAAMPTVTAADPLVLNDQPRQRFLWEMIGRPWTVEDIAFLKKNYPIIGKLASARMLGRSEASVRAKAAHLGLKLNTCSTFFLEFQERAGQSKVGRKRPNQAEVIRKLHAAGKLKHTAAQRLKLSESSKKWIAERGHPRGSLGMKHTAETKQKISESSKMAAARMTPEQWQARILKSQKTRVAKGTKFNPRGSWKAGWRDIGKQRIYCRSRWEANYARFLEWQRNRGDIAKWEHEPETFWFEKVKRGSVSYLPDFRVTYLDGTIEYHEVKGWMDARSRTKIKRMKKYHPAVKLVVIDAKSYRQLAKVVCATIPGWE